jgi:hypothetical protein
MMIGISVGRSKVSRGQSAFVRSCSLRLRISSAALVRISLSLGAAHLLHAENDGLQRRRRAPRVLLALVGLDQSGERLKLGAPGRTLLGIHESVNAVESATVVLVVA